MSLVYRICFAALCGLNSLSFSSFFFSSRSFSDRVTQSFYGIAQTYVQIVQPGLSLSGGGKDLFFLIFPMFLTQAHFEVRL